MAITIYTRDDPHASAATAVAFVVFTLAFAGLAVALFRPLLVSEPVRLPGARNVPHGGTR